MHTFAWEYKYVFEVEYWPIKSVLVTSPTSDIVAPFVPIVQWFLDRMMPIIPESDVWRDYLRFALQWYKNRKMRPVPNQLKQPLIYREFSQLRAIQEPVEQQFHYEKFLLPEFRFPQFKKLLGLT